MKLTSALFWGCLALAVVSGMNRDRMPSKGEILPQVLQEPVQTETQSPAFSFDLKNKRYTVTPVRSYEIWGVVVSSHSANAAFDYYHEKSGDDLNPMDLCVVWGDNVRNEVWRSMRFTSGSWTCWAQALPGRCQEAARTYRNECLSNNHLLARDAALAGRLQGVRRGDQIHIRGQLVTYTHSGWGEGRRGTSTTRSDLGCEVIYVSQFDMLRRANPFWRALFPWSIAGIFVSVAGAFLKFWQETGRLRDRDQQSQ